MPELSIVDAEYVDDDQVTPSPETRTMFLYPYPPRVVCSATKPSPGTASTSPRYCKEFGPTGPGLGKLRREVHVAASGLVTR